MTARQRAGTYLLLAATLLAGRTVVSVLAGTGLGVDVALHAAVVPLVQLALVEAALRARGARS